MRSEQNAIVFVSSIMDSHLNELREETVNAVEDISYADPWAFEFTPASSESADKQYLRKVREAVFVLWLVGKEVSTAVKDEIREALANNRRLLVFKLPVNNRSDETKALIREAQNQCIWTELTNKNELSKKVKLTIEDEIVRALQNEPSIGRLGHLELKFRYSRARCLERWQSTGIHKDQAECFYENYSIGSPETRVSGIPDQSLTILVGEQGVGKSLLAERLLQKAITQARNDSEAPVPLFLKAQEIDDNLEDKFFEETEGLRNPQIHGVMAIIDGADEAGNEKTREVLAQSRRIVEAWPSSKIIITSRPLPALSDAEEAVRVKPLEKTQALELVNTISENEVTESKYHSWPEALQEAIELPLFALLVGVYFSEHDQAPGSKIQLLRYLVENSLGEELKVRQRELLQKAAIETTDRSYGKVPKGEVAMGPELELLSNSRLIVEHENSIEFPLSIVAQWFAAQSLMNGEPSPESLLSDTKRLVRWMYPLAIFLVISSHDRVSYFLAPIVESDPGFVSRLLDQVKRDWSYSKSDTGFSYPTVKECGRKIVEVAKSWKCGLGKLAPIVFQTSEDRELPVLGVNKRKNKFTAGWLKNDEDLGDVQELAYEEFFSPEKCRTFSSGPLPRSPAWAWDWVTSDIKSIIEGVLDKRDLAVKSGPLFEEATWLIAKKIVDQEQLNYDPIPIEKLQLSQDMSDERKLSHKYFPWYTVGDLRRQIEKLKQEGKEQISAPYPVPDYPSGKKNGQIWDLYSTKQLKNRLQVVFEHSIGVYKDFVETWFSLFKNRMETYVLLPAELKGRLLPSPEKKETKRTEAPKLNWYLEPKTGDERSTVNLEIVDELTWRSERDVIEELVHVTFSRRPLHEEWISFSGHHVGAETFLHQAPIVRLVYDWLDNDLFNAKMTSWSMNSLSDY